jgi:hypothetical protein
VSWTEVLEQMELFLAEAIGQETNRQQVLNSDNPSSSAIPDVVAGTNGHEPWSAKIQGCHQEGEAALLAEDRALAEKVDQAHQWLARLESLRQRLAAGGEISIK